jgi:signal transduction histidine kinase
MAPKLVTASDLLLVGLTALFAAADVAIWADHPAVDTGRVSVSIAALVPCVGVVATIAVAMRRRAHSSALAAVAALGIALTIATWIIGTSLPPSFAALVALALLSVRVLRHERTGNAMTLTGTAALSVAAEATRPFVAEAAYLVLVSEAAFAVAVGIGLYLRWSDWRRIVAAEAARTDERLDIARELHDLVGHYVTGIVVQAQAAQHVAAHRPDAAAAALARIETAGAEALTAMRTMVGGLRTQTATWESVDQLVADAVAQGEPVTATIDPLVRESSLPLVPSVHRIIAESLTNTRRHGRDVSTVEVAAFRRDDRLVVTVHDHGHAATTTTRHDAYGIVGMRERATALGGSLTAGPASDGGWLVHAELPMEHPR